jgi:hypothetical protein
METEAQPAPSVFFRPVDSNDLQHIIILEVSYKINYLYPPSSTRHDFNFSNPNDSHLYLVSLSQEASYPPDEAASADNLQLRLEKGGW